MTYRSVGLRSRDGEMGVGGQVRRAVYRQPHTSPNLRASLFGVLPPRPCRSLYALIRYENSLTFLQDVSKPPCALDGRISLVLSRNYTVGVSSRVLPEGFRPAKASLSSDVPNLTVQNEVSEAIRTVG